MPLEDRLHLRQVDRFGVLLRERHVDVVVKNDHQADLAGEVEDAIERGIGEAGGFTGDLRRDELLVDAELADAGEHARKGPQHAADVIGGVHVGRD